MKSLVLANLIEEWSMEENEQLKKVQDVLGNWDADPDEKTEQILNGPVDYQGAKKTVPLVMYINGRRKIIGTAVVENGTAAMMIDSQADEELLAVLSGPAKSVSFSLPPGPLYDKLYPSD